MLALTQNQQQTYILQLTPEELIRDEFESDSDSDTEDMYKSNIKNLKQYSILKAHDKEAFEQMNIAFDMYMEKLNENLVLQQNLVQAQQSLILAQHSLIDVQDKQQELYKDKIKLNEMLDNIQKLAQGKNSPEWVSIQSILKDR